MRIGVSCTFNEEEERMSKGGDSSISINSIKSWIKIIGGPCTFKNLLLNELAT